MSLTQTCKSFLGRWTRFVIRHAVLVILGSVIVTALLADYAFRNLGISTETEHMIAENLGWRQNFIKFRTQFPELYRTIVVVVTADTEATAQAAVVHLSGLLEIMPEFVASHYSPTIDEPLGGRELLYLDNEDLRDLADSVASAQPFLGRLREDFSLIALFDLLATAAARDQLHAADVFMSRVSSVIDLTLDGRDPVLDWSNLSDDEGRVPRRLIFVKPVMHPNVPRAARYALEALRAAGAQTADEFDARANVRLTGLVALEDEELVNVADNAKTTGLLALASVVLVLMFAFRNIRLLLISILTLLAGLIGTAAFAAWSVRSLNIISVAFAVLYIGLGIDFVIHYLLRMREVSAQGVVSDEALVIASEEVGGSIFICAITTAAGFYAFIPTSFIGVSQLGLVSGTGMFISFASTLTVLPALIHIFFPRGLQVAGAAASWAPGRRLSRLLVYRRVILAVPLILAAAILWNVDKIRFESDPMLLRDPAMDSVKTFRELSNDPDTTPTAISVVLPPDQEIDAAKEALEQLPSVERALSLTSFEIDAHDGKLDIIDDLSLLLGASFDRFPQIAEVDLAGTRTALGELRDALLSKRDILGSDAQALLGTLSRLEATIDGMTAAAQRELLLRLAANLLGDLPQAMNLLATRLQPAAVSLGQFPESFVARWRSPDAAQLIQVIPAQDVSNPEYAETFVTEVLGVAPQATGMPVVYHESGATVIAAFVQAFASAFIAISILLFILLRSGYDTLLVLAPLATAALLLTGIMIIIDMPFNFANIIVLPLLLGIGVDTGIHLVHRTRESLADNAHLLETSTSRAILFGSATTLASFGNLGLSTHRGMASMGILLSAGLAVILVVMILVLPVLLNLERR